MGATIITFGGESASITEWAEQLGISYVTLQKRLKRGWSAEDALLTPVRAWTPGGGETRPRYVAHHRVQQAVRDGVLTRPNRCERCGRSKEDNNGRAMDGHHWHGYGEAHVLDVIWLCQSCHMREHARWANYAYHPDRDTSVQKIS